MKATIKIGVILCVGYFLVSCKPTTIKGKVINPINGKGIEGISIAAGTGTMELPGGYKTKEKVVSDADGNFVLQYKGEAQISVSVGTNYYPVGWHLNGETVKGITPERGEATHADYYAVPYGKLQINIKNTSCFNQNDSLIIFRTQSLPNFYNNVPNPAIYVGCIDRVGNMNKAPMGWYKYEGKVIRNGIEIPIKDSIYLDAGENKVWDIYY